MKKRKVLVAALVATLLYGSASTAKAGEGYFEKNNQVFFRGAFSLLTNARDGEVFTDTLGLGGASNTGKGGFSIGAGLDLGMTPPEALFGVASLAGEVSLELSRYSKKSVLQTTSFLTGGTALSAVPVTELNVSVNPKVKFDTLGRFRPYIIPVGLAFLVNSPPSNDTTYLDLGINFGAGLDIYLTKLINVGLDARYTLGFEMSRTNTSYFSTGGHLGINF